MFRDRWLRPPVFIFGDTRQSPVTLRKERDGWSIWLSVVSHQKHPRDTKVKSGGQECSPYTCKVKSLSLIHI